MRKLKVQELENRIAPGYGLFSFLSGLAGQDAEFGELFNAVVDQTTGEVDVDTAADVINSAGGPQVAPVNENFTLSDDIVISDRVADALSSIFGR